MSEWLVTRAWLVWTKDAPPEKKAEWHASNEADRLIRECGGTPPPLKIQPLP